MFKRFLPVVFAVTLSTLTHAEGLSDKVRLLVDEATPVAMLKVLSNIPGQDQITSVDLLAFSFAIDKKNAAGQREVDLKLDSTKIAARLVELKNAGVTVRVILDTIRPSVRERNLFTAKHLRAAGIEVQDKETHAKGLLINRKALIVGSSNLTQQSLIKNNETNLAITEENMVKAYADYFDCRWKAPNEETCKRVVESPDGQWKFLTETFYKGELLRLINEAKENLEFSIYAFNDSTPSEEKNLEAALVRAVTERKVKVKALFNQKVNASSESSEELVESNKKIIEKLKAIGVQMVALASDDAYTHSKYLIRDRREVLIGSGNWIDADFDAHPQVYFLLNEKLVGEQKESFLAGQLGHHLAQQLAYETKHEQIKYHRFWIGYKKPSFQLVEFDKAIDSLFVKATVRAGGGRGLASYMPVLPRHGGEQGDAVTKYQVPDEFALVSYGDDWLYGAIRESEVGREYGPLHEDYFAVDRTRSIETDPDKSLNSSSFVPGAFGGVIEINKAYDFTPKANWQKTSYARLTTVKDDVSNVENYRASLEVFMRKVHGQIEEGTSPLSAYVVAVLPNFIVEYYQIKHGQEELAEELLSHSSERAEVFNAAIENHKLEKASPEAPGLSREEGAKAGVTAEFSATIGDDQKKLIMSESARSLLRSADEQAKVQEQIRKELRGQK